jgi:diguanylate cyclase (GGDEF)-like protein/PAS domain S-box-containing protein
MTRMATLLFRNPLLHCTIGPGAGCGSVLNNRHHKRHVRGRGMNARSVAGHPVLIIGAGRGGTALLEMFMEDNLATVLAIADSNPEAPGFELARKHGVPTYTDANAALHACKEYPDCIIYNLSHDEAIEEAAFKVFGDRRVTGGAEVKLFWQMVTNLKRVKGELEKSQDELQAIIRNVMDGIITIDEKGSIQGFNPAAERIFGYESREVLGQNVKLLMPEPNRSEHDAYLHRYVHSNEKRVLGMRGREVVAVRKDGGTFPMELSASEMLLGGQRYFIGIVRDITERKQTEERIAHLAHHDFLTGLPNRASFLGVLDHSVGLSKRNKHILAVLFLDLDGFKQINDTLGHEAGDLLLKGVSGRLLQTLRESDTVARLGGDEFIVLLENLSSEDSAALVAEKIIAALAEPFDLNGQPGRVGASIGIALFPHDSSEARELVRQADEAMYRAKHGGKNIWKSYRDK